MGSTADPDLDCEDLLFHCAYCHKHRHILCDFPVKEVVAEKAKNLSTLVKAVYKLEQQLPSQAKVSVEEQIWASDGQSCQTRVLLQI